MNGKRAIKRSDAEWSKRAKARRQLRVTRPKHRGVGRFEAAGDELARRSYWLGV